MVFESTSDSGFPPNNSSAIFRPLNEPAQQTLTTINVRFSYAVGKLNFPSHVKIHGNREKFRSLIRKAGSAAAGKRFVTAKESPDFGFRPVANTPKSN
jgi:hypothetical protein